MAIKVYLDTVTIIAAVEGDDDDIAGRLAEILTNEKSVCVSSDLALAELLVGAWRSGKREHWLADAYQGLFSRGDALSAVSVERPILIRAAALRATDLALKLPDAIQLATALATDCEVMLSNDRKLRRVGTAAGLSVCSLDPADLDALLARIEAT